ncbi:MarR family winged helix-turn-helix transcriptional regulator [Calderihabitans maritimus]|uniref:MarR family transcriptional regulator n=1 Tax=Calderihabitans maritimus TaxID=1246530 RepID=A0A1Z5HUZ6_9FIRM|nr:MarR family transcriptional regulator [Calderihabitans maritimus]GAW93353.1 MarR family transcriptional regulator [Calderihabitans maritimus]
MELHECINFLLSKAQQAVYRLFREELAPFGVTPAQYGVLNCLWNKDQQTPKQISETLHLDGSTLTGVLDRMEQKGLVRRIPDPHDRRTVRIALTSKGQELKRPLEQAIVRANNKVLENLSEEEVRQIKRLLDRLSENPGRD